MPADMHDISNIRESQVHRSHRPPRPEAAPETVVPVPTAHPSDSDAATYLRIAFGSAAAILASLVLLWAVVSLAAGSLGFTTHSAFLLLTALAGTAAGALRRALVTHTEELGEFEFSMESSSARQVAAESALLVYRDMLQEAGIGWYRLDAEGHLITATQATVDLLGYASVDQMREAYDGRIFPASEHRKAVLSALRAVGEVRGHSASWPTAQGDILQVRDSARTIRDHEGKILYIEGFVSADTWAPGSDARIQRLEAELSAARAELVEAPRAGAQPAGDLQYVAHMSHELRTPLGAIVGSVALLENARLDRSHRELVENIRSAADSLLSIVDHTLEYSRLDSGTIDLASDPVDARACIEDAVSAFAQRAADKGIELAYRIADHVPEAFHGDAVRLREILTNLLSNAVRYTTEGEILVRLDGEPAANGRFEYRFTVRDTGPGIPPERLRAVFEPWFRADPETGRPSGGTGLGLTVARMLVERMGGTIDVQSQPGNGSTFRFSIPARPAPDPGRVDARPVAGLRALLFDDRSSSRSHLSALLESLHLSVNATNRADLAVDLLRGDSTFDLVVVSEASAVNAVAFASRLRSQGIAAQLPIVLVLPVGATSDAPTLPRCSVIARPLRRDRLVEVLTEAVGPDPSSGRQTRKTSGSLSVLVAEDDSVNGRVITRMIERLGHKATLVERGDAVAEAAETARYDVLLLDVRLPGLTGPEAARAVQQRLGPVRGVPAMIGMTASTDRAEHRECLDAGMSACLLKPITPQVLGAALERAAALPAQVPDAGTAAPAPDLGRWIGESDSADALFEGAEPVAVAAESAPAADDPVTASIRRATASRFRNDRAAVASALMSIERSTPERLRELQAALESGDFHRLAELAARLKDECTAVGLSRPAALAKALEATSRGNPRPAAALPFVRAIQAAFDDVMPVVRRERSRF